MGQTDDDLNEIITAEEMYRHQRLCEELRDGIRRQLQDLGYGMMSLEEAERVARRLTERQ